MRSPNRIFQKSNPKSRTGKATKTNASVYEFRFDAIKMVLIPIFNLWKILNEVIFSRA